jgi:hypothetical protein
MIERAAVAADLGIKAHAHMLRHACGYKLANDGRDTRAIELIGTPTGCAPLLPGASLEAGRPFHRWILTRWTIRRINRWSCGFMS